MSDVPDGHGRSRSHDLRRPFITNAIEASHGRSKSHDLSRTITAVKLWAGKSIILPDLRAQDVICHLIQDGVFDEEEEETVLHEITTKARAQKLFDMILLKGDFACMSLGKALWRVSPHIMTSLNEVKVSGSDAEAFKRWRLTQEVPDEPDGHVATQKHMGELLYTVL